MGDQLNKRIGIDLDNTVADYMAKATPRLKEMFGIEPKNAAGCTNPEAAFLWGGREKATPRDKWQELGLEPEDKKLLYTIRQGLYVEERFFRDLPMIEQDTNRLTHQLRSMGYRIYFITARTGNQTIMEDTLFWLKVNNFVYDDVFFTYEKATLCSLMNIPIMFEDDRTQIDACLERGIRTIAMEQPWNAGIDNAIFSRVNSWREALAVVKEHQ